MIAPIAPATGFAAEQNARPVIQVIADERNFEPAPFYRRAMHQTEM